MLSTSGTESLSESITRAYINIQAVLHKKPIKISEYILPN